MKSSLLMWRLFTFIMVTDCVTVLLLPSREQLELSSLHLTVLQRNFSRATSAPNAHKTEEILSTSGHESTTPCSGIAISAHGITHSFLFGTKIDTSFSSLTAFCTLSNKNKGRIECCEFPGSFGGDDFTRGCSSDTFPDCGQGCLGFPD